MKKTLNRKKTMKKTPWILLDHKLSANAFPPQASFHRRASFTNRVSSLVLQFGVHDPLGPSHNHGQWVFSHIASVLPFEKSRTWSENSDCYWLAGLWVWPSGSLMTPVLSNIFLLKVPIVGLATYIRAHSLIHLAYQSNIYVTVKLYS